MMLPESVMKVMPMATQPMKDIVVISDTRLTVDRNPGVPSANATSAASAIARTASTHALAARGRKRQPDPRGQGVTEGIASSPFPICQDSRRRSRWDG